MLESTSRQLVRLVLTSGKASDVAPDLQHALMLLSPRQGISSCRCSRRPADELAGLAIGDGLTDPIHQVMAVTRNSWEVAL